MALCYYPDKTKQTKRVALCLKGLFMKASSANLLSVIKGPKQFVIPIYQRTYSWHQAQCEQLFKDILRISQSDNIHGHFVGSVVYSSKVSIPFLMFRVYWSLTVSSD
jgi:hypothetical protein